MEIEKIDNIMNEILNIVEEKEIKNMLETNPNIKELSEQEIINLLNLLEQIGCNERQIRNIITCNPFYLNRSISDLVKLIRKLELLGIAALNITFDSNPYLLNKDSYEIDEFIEKKKKEGISLEDIIDIIDAGMVDE